MSSVFTHDFLGMSQHPFRTQYSFRCHISLVSLSLFSLLPSSLSLPYRFSEWPYLVHFIVYVITDVKIYPHIEHVVTWFLLVTKIIISRKAMQSRLLYIAYFFSTFLLQSKQCKLQLKPSFILIYKEENNRKSYYC